MMQGKQVLTERCADIAMLVLDVDGVLTDGRIVYDDSGKELKFSRPGARWASGRRSSRAGLRAPSRSARPSCRLSP